MSFWIIGGITQCAADGDLAGVERLLDGGVPVDFIENGRYNDSPLQVAARGGHLAVVKLLLSHGANVNHFDNDLFSPVTAATAARSWAVAECLAEHGGDFSRCDATGRCGLDYLKQCRSKARRAKIEAILSERAVGPTVSAPRRVFSRAR